MCQCLTEGHPHSTPFEAATTQPAQPLQHPQPRPGQPQPGQPAHPGHPGHPGQPGPAGTAGQPAHAKMPRTSCPPRVRLYPSQVAGEWPQSFGGPLKFSMTQRLLRIVLTCFDPTSLPELFCRFLQYIIVIVIRSCIIRMAPNHCNSNTVSTRRAPVKTLFLRQGSSADRNWLIIENPVSTIMHSMILYIYICNGMYT